jgi:hypothetical protein
MATQPQLAVDKVIPWINPYEYILNTNQGDFVYIPKDIVNKGYVAERYEWLGSGGDLRQTKEKRQYFHPEFLNQDFLGQAKAVNLDQGVFTDEQKKALSDSVGGDVTNGYLFPAVKYFETVKSSPTFYSISESAPPISGIKSISDQGVNEAVNFDSGYKYVIGEGNDKQFDFINPDSSIITLTAGEAPSGGRGKLGKELRRAAIKIGQVPFLTQATAFIPVVGPYVYSALRGAQMGVSGKDPLEAGVQVGAEILLANAVKSAIGGTPVDVGVEPGAGVEVYPVDPGVTPDVTPIGGTPVLPPVDYGLLGDASLPTAAPGMGGGRGITATLPPLPDAGVLGSAPVDYGLGPQTTPGIDGGVGLKQPTMPNVGGMGGGQGITVPVSGGTVGELGLTPSGATPVLGDPGSFINDPNVLGTDVIPQGTPMGGFSPRDATRALRSAYNLLNPAEAGGAGGGVDQGGAQQSMGGVDYSGLYNLLAQRAIAGGLLGTRYQPQPVNLASLLG